LTFGWGRPESTGTWTQGPLALVRLGLEPGVDRARPLVVDLDASPLVEPLHPRLDVDVVVNGRTVGEWIFQSPSAAHRQARIPPALFADRRSIDVELRFRNPDAPIDLELGPPNGILGLKVISLAVAYEP
jgi:hypothetical protein